MQCKNLIFLGPDYFLTNNEHSSVKSIKVLTRNNMDGVYEY